MTTHREYDVQESSVRACGLYGPEQAFFEKTWKMNDIERTD